MVTYVYINGARVVRRTDDNVYFVDQPERSFVYFVNGERVDFFVLPKYGGFAAITTGNPPLTTTKARFYGGSRNFHSTPIPVNPDAFEQNYNDNYWTIRVAKDGWLEEIRASLDIGIYVVYNA